LSFAALTASASASRSNFGEDGAPVPGGTRERASGEPAPYGASCKTPRQAGGKRPPARPGCRLAAVASRIRRERGIFYKVKSQKSRKILAVFAFDPGQRIKDALGRVPHPRAPPRLPGPKRGRFLP
jgi:hypothetical protein